MSSPYWSLPQRKLGANVADDVSCEWLSFFMESDERLEQIRTEYGSGAMLTGEVKKELIEILQTMVREHQERRAQVTAEVVQQFLEIRALEF